MRIKKIVIVEDSFDLKSSLEYLGISQRKFAKLTPYKWFKINRICNGEVCSEICANRIKDAYNKLLEPKFRQSVKSIKKICNTI